jgi:hypothetical protein
MFEDEAELALPLNRRQRDNAQRGTISYMVSGVVVVQAAGTSVVNMTLLADSIQVAELNLATFLLR